MSSKVFVSVGRASTSEQAETIKAVLNTLQTIGLSPRMMYENEWSYKQPLLAIRRVMSECDGAVIVAFTRFRFTSGIELTKDSEPQMSNILLPTVWNQIEARWHT